MLCARGRRASGDSPRLICLVIFLAIDGLWFFEAKYRYDEEGGIKTCLNAFRHYIDGGLVEVENVISRHEKLAQEIQNSGFKHKSPLPDFKEYRA